MTDGAHLRISASRALDSILGDQEDPDDVERMTPAEFAAWVRAAPDGVAAEASAASYTNAARLIARRLLAVAEAHPEIDWLHAPATDDVEFPDGVGDGSDWDERWARRRVLREGVDSLWRRLDSAGYRATMDEIGPTGFQFGWAVNAVRSILGLPPTANPAIMEV